MYSCWDHGSATPSAEPALPAPDLPPSLQRAGYWATTVSKWGDTSTALLPTGSQTSFSHCVVLCSTRLPQGGGVLVARVPEDLWARWAPPPASCSLSPSKLWGALETWGPAYALFYPSLSRP